MVSYGSQVVRSISPMLHEKLKLRLLALLPCIFKCIRHPHVAVRLSASRCISTMAKSLTADVMASVMGNAIPMLGDMTCTFARQGTGMLISLLVQGLGVELVPYAPLLVVPLLRCMSDSDPSVRQSVTHSFAALVPLLPLAKGLPPPDGVTEELFGNKEDARFLEQLLDNSHIDDYKLCTEIKVTLRRYIFLFKLMIQKRSSHDEDLRVLLVEQTYIWQFFVKVGCLNTGGFFNLSFPKYGSFRTCLVVICI